MIVRLFPQTKVWATDPPQGRVIVATRLVKEMGNDIVRIVFSALIFYLDMFPTMKN